MNFFPTLFFLLSLSCLSLIVLLLLRILDFANVASRQKLLFLKISLVIIGCAPFVFIILRLYAWSPLAITLSENFIQQPTHAAYVEHNDQQINWSFYFFAMYFLGFSVMFFRIIFSYLQARKQLATSTSAIIQGQTVFINENIQNPLSFGFPIGKIYFPQNAEKKWTQREIQMSLAHEKIHVEQNDSLWKLFSLSVQAILFFAPWSYTLHRRLELEIEIVCDEKTCIETNADVQEYGSLLLAMAAIQPQNLLFTNIIDTTLKRRLLAMKSKTIKRPFLILILSAVLLMAGSIATAMTSGFTEKETIFKITSKIMIDGKLISSPHIIAYANQKALIVITNSNNAGAQGLRMELVARNIAKLSHNDIEINYDIEYKNGAEKMHAKPKIVIAPHQETKIAIPSNSNHLYEMSVLAERE